MDVRYDYDNNGVWDTDYVPLEVNADYSPMIVSNPIWTARCEVRDEAGNTAEAVASMDLSASDLVPGYPDIVAGKITAPDTIGVDEPFLVLIAERCWVDSSSTSYKTEMYLDDALWVEQWGLSDPSVGSCSSHGRVGLSISTLGPHEITVVLEAEDVLAEVDETNNAAQHTIVVVPSSVSWRMEGNDPPD
jgi:hypothetical protein